MNRIITLSAAIAVSLSLAGSALAHGKVWQPPAGISTSCKVPTQYVDYWSVHKACVGHNASANGGRMEACVRKTANSWTMILPQPGNDISAADVEELRRHECGHVNGWGADHNHAH